MYLSGKAFTSSRVPVHIETGKLFTSTRVNGLVVHFVHIENCTLSERTKKERLDFSRLQTINNTLVFREGNKGIVDGLSPA